MPTPITQLATLDRTSPTFVADVDAFFASKLQQFINEANAVALAMNLNSVSDTSTTSGTIGLGAMTFTVSANKSFLPGMFLVIAAAASPSTNSVTCQVTSYNSTTGALVVNCLVQRGSGTFTSWVITMASDPKFITDNVTDLLCRNLTASGHLRTISPIAEFGYATGAGNWVIQATSKATGVTINTPTGMIRTASDNMAIAAVVSFTVTNSMTSIYDTIIVNINQTSGTGYNYQVWVTKLATGSFQISIKNISGVALAETFDIQYSIVQGAIS